MDEPTSYVDKETDETVQRCIKEQFRGVTIVTIAHRIETLEGYDMIVSLEDGKINDIKYI